MKGVFLTLLLSLYVGDCFGGYCTQTYSCAKTCYRRSSYTTSCGFLGWWSCTEYRQRGYTCYDMCSRQICCPGYSGAYCDLPICFGKTSCPNGGVCTAPDDCECAVGFGGLRCDDINECATNNGGCQHVCVNIAGSYHCQCMPGNVLALDKKSCVDEDECTSGTAQCDHGCINTIGLFRCTCREGYELSVDQETCEDVDECTANQYPCMQNCHNNAGSFSCSCMNGFQLQRDWISCVAINRCAVRNGGCEQICQSEAGQQSCDCFNGYRLKTDLTTCSDIDECTKQLSGCEHYCNNTVGSFICSCKKGFQLDSNNKTCSDEDDCVGITCQNGGSCVDGLSSYSCACTGGFEGTHCQTDIDECQYFNGGCEEICTNMIGSYKCSCPAGRTLLPDGRTCSDGPQLESVFQRLALPRNLLPRGCHSLTLHTSVDGVLQSLTMLSTSPWYTRTSNSDVVVTEGVVMVNTTSSTVPVSLAGVELDLSQSVSIITQYKGRSFADLIPSLREVIDTNDCIAQNLSSRDMYEFISSDSLINTIFDRLLSLLPPWLTLDKAQIINHRVRRSSEILEHRVHRHKRSLVDINNLNTHVVLGEQVENIQFCKGAPVKPGNRYSVLQFQTNFSVEVFDNKIFLPSPLRGEEFCLIVDISVPGSVFLTIPEQSRDLFLQLDIFQTLNDKNGFHMKPRGIGLSLNQGVQVPSRHKELTLWNGDHKFKYRIRKEASVWLGGDMTYSSSVLTINASVDMYFTVPDVKDMLIAMFIEEWNAFATAKASGNVTFKFRLMGKNYTLFLQDLLTSNLDMYMSVGGLQTRQWCGQFANPPGVFFSALLQINPFKGVPIVGDWLFYNTHKIYAFAMTDPASRITPNMTIDIRNDIIQIKDVVTRFKSLLDTEKRRLQSLVSNITFLVINELSRKLIVFETDIIQVLAKWQIDEWSISDIKEVLKRFWKSLSDMKELTRKIRDQLEHYIDAVVQNFRSYIQTEIDIIKKNIAIAIGKLRSQISDALKKYSAFGLKYRTTLTLFGLDIVGVDLEVVYSADFLMRCSRFDKVRNLLKGEEAFRALGRISVGRKLGYFISAQFGGGVGVAISKSSDKVVVQLNAFVSMLGIRFTGDLLITKNSLSTYVEGNVWGLFLAQIDIKAETGNKSYQLTFNVRGRFVANAGRKKRQVQTRSESFQESYLDALKNVVRRTADWAERRLSDAQDAFKAGEKGLSKAQNWLDEKKEDLRGANKLFDKAVEKLQRAKDKLEAAKEPFKRALEKLNKAQRRVDRLCRIRSCRKICLPGVKCKICRIKIGWFRIPIPCCRFTTCMISFPNPICVAANLACTLVRAIAYAALEAAKLIVRVPMIALDIAKAAVSVAQFAVDKSRVVLKVAEGVLEVAKLGLEGAKAILRIARGALEAIKIAIGAAAQILEFVISFGLQSLVDVKNCGFDVQLSTFDLPIFQVGCDVNLFRLGWIPVHMKINFKNPIASLWSAAKATIDAVVKNFMNVFGKRKRREIAFEATNQILRALRKARSVGNDTDFLQLLNDTAVLFNNSIDITNDFVGLDEANNDQNNFDYENRRLSFARKCTLLTAHLNFIKDTIETLFDLSNETKESMEIFSYADGNLDKFSINEIGGNMTLEKANISVDYAKHYNLTKEDLEQAMKDAKQVIMNDEYLQDIDQVASSSKATMQAEADSVDINMFINSWMTTLENITAGHFNESDCVDFRDCLLHSLSTMYDLYSGDEHSNISEIEPVLDEIAENIFSIVRNSTLSLDEIYNNTHALKRSLSLLKGYNVYCSKPPTFTTPLSNVTVYEGGTAVFECDVIAFPDPRVWWFKDDELIDGETKTKLKIGNVSIKDVARYSCMAGNLVANLTSNKADLLIAENIHNISTCSVDNGGCDQLCTNMVGTVLCTCNEGYKISSVDRTKCEDIDECTEMQHGCKSCNNSDGSFTCVCSTGHMFDEQNKRCIKGNDKCALINLDCSQTYGCHVDETGGMACYCDDGFILSLNGTTCIDVDECQQNVCDHTCTNTLGSYTCSCNIGYQFQFDECVACEFPFWGSDCSNVCNCAAASSCDPVKGCLCEEGWEGESCDIDVDECQVHPNICNNTVQECFNEEGFYSCLCPEGYTEADNGSCVDIKECSEIETQCSQICNELEGSFSCDCYSGYYLNTDNKTCLDIKECSQTPSPCGQICIEMEGSYKCTCQDGFNLERDNFSCTDIDECQQNVCDHTCTNTLGSYICSCHDGYQLQYDVCVDIDECQQNVCDHTCANTLGSYTCSCREGYQLQYDKCVDIKECSEIPSPCSQLCIEMMGSYKCTCEDGFYLDDDNTTCTDIEECSQTPSPCGQICIELEGSYKCTCQDGFHLAKNNSSCTDIKECSEIPSPCGQLCTEMIGSYVCTCEDGFYLDDDNTTCTECHNNTFGHNCLHDCNCNPSHSYNQLQTCNTVTGRCVCNAQWTGITCNDDVNECSNLTICDHVTNAGCHNEMGSFECDCLRGYSKLESGDCIKDTTNNNPKVSSKSKIEIRLTLRMEMAFPDHSNLNVSRTYAIVSENSKATVLNFYKGYTNDDFEIAIHDFRLGSLIVDFSLLMNNSRDSYQSVVRATWVLLNGVSLHYTNQSVAAKLVRRKQDIDQCLLRSELVGPCDDEEECVRDQNGPICRKKDSGTVVFLIPGITIILVALVTVIISCILRCKCRNRTQKFGENNDLDLSDNDKFKEQEGSEEQHKNNLKVFENMAYKLYDAEEMVLY